MSKMMTKREALNSVLSNWEAIPQDVAEVLTKMVAQLDKASEAERKPSKAEIAKQDENAKFKAEIIANLADGAHRTVSEIIKAVPALNGASTQKVSALMRLLKMENRVDKEVVKGKTLFFLI